MKSEIKLFLILITTVVSCGNAAALVTSNSGTNPFNGYSINEFIGAETFYKNGYTGSRSIVANIEAGHAWNRAISLDHIDKFLDARSKYQFLGIDYGSLGQYDNHATMVSSIIGGRGQGEYQKGVAYGATVWSGAIATEWYSDLSFGWSTGHAFTVPYDLALLFGVNGRRADVVNSSYGGSSDQSGSNAFSIAIDGIVKSSSKTVVFSAMNAGPAPNTIGWPQSGYNVINVGALGDDLNSYKAIANFSSRSPSDYMGVDGFVPNARARVDIVAPGENITSAAYYGGTTGGNLTGFDESGGATNWHSWNIAGTSFAAPMVAAGATLLNDVAYDRYLGNDNSHDGQVIKAVLLNSAKKPVGWDNGQFVDEDGVIRTSQSLDYTYGAGMLDLSRSFEQFTGGTSDVIFTQDLNFVEATGWDFGILVNGSHIDYVTSRPVNGDGRMNATLTWFVGRSWIGNEENGAISVSDDFFTNLSLQLFGAGADGSEVLIAESDSGYINTEHLSLELPYFDLYKLRVNWVGERYNQVGNMEQTFGLAWSFLSPVPDQSTLRLFVCGLVFVIGVVKKKLSCY